MSAIRGGLFALLLIAIGVGFALWHPGATAPIDEPVSVEDPTQRERSAQPRVSETVPPITDEKVEWARERWRSGVIALLDDESPIVALRHLEAGWVVMRYEDDPLWHVRFLRCMSTCHALLGRPIQARDLRNHATFLLSDRAAVMR